MATAFKFLPLNSERQEIRLVHLAPDSTPSHIKLTTQHTALNQTPKYSALSYTWGAPYEGLSPEWDDPGSTRTICLDGQNFEVRWNLHAALTVLCATPAMFPTMWIDAICIDQSNIQERNSQVLLMGEIYKKAKFTFIWLGPYSERFAGALAWIHIYTQLYDDHSRQFSHQASQEFPQRLARLLDCSWFRRIWVVQEVALSQRLFLLTGNGNGSFARWEVLESTILWIEQHLLKFATAHDLQDSEWPLLYSFAEVMKSATWFQRSSGIRLAHQTNSGLNLKMVLGSLQLFKASDARDKVYGALGLLSKCDFVKVDYNSSASDVFIATTQGWLENTRDLSILGLCQSSEILDFPSWAVDFTIESAYSPLGSFYTFDPSKNLYTAGGVEPANFRFENTKTLVISGVQLGVLSFTGSKTAWNRFCETPSPNIEIEIVNMRGHKKLINFHTLQKLWLEEWIDLRVQIGAKEDVLKKYPWTQDNMPEAYIRTLFADAIKHSTYSKRLDEDLNWAKHRLSKEELHNLSENLPSHVFATTSERHFCLVRKDVLVDDVVVIANGAETPYVLHPNGNGTYAFRGFCYVHGFMDGEAFKSTDLSAPKKRMTSSEFRIV